MKMMRMTKSHLTIQHIRTVQNTMETVVMKLNLDLKIQKRMPHQTRLSTSIPRPRCICTTWQIWTCRTLLVSMILVDDFSRQRLRHDVSLGLLLSQIKLQCLVWLSYVEISMRSRRCIVRSLEMEIKCHMSSWVEDVIGRCLYRSLVLRDKVQCLKLSYLLQ